MAHPQKRIRDNADSFLWMGPAGFEPATDRLCIPLQLSLPDEVCGLDCPFTPKWGPASQSLHLPRKGLGSGLPTK